MRMRVLFELSPDINEGDTFNRLKLETSTDIDLRFPSFIGYNIDTGNEMLKNAFEAAFSKIKKKAFEDIFLRKKRSCKNCRHSNIEGNCSLGIEDETCCMRNDLVSWRNK